VGREGTPDVQVSVLGSVGVRGDGTETELGTRLRRLLAALAVSNRSVVSTDRLVEIVWAGRPPDGADTTLRSYVTRLRRALGSDARRIVFREPGYVIDLATDELDSAVFEEELDRALQHLRTAESTAARGLLERAIARWRGPAYAGFAEEEWARPESVRLEERLVEAREALIESMLADGLDDEAAAEAQSLVESEPLREGPRALAMRAMYASGRQAEALRVASSYRRYLADETGLDPSEEIVALERRIARGDTSLTSGTTPLRGYELGERIGEGAFSVVHRAVQPGVDRDVAIKIIRAELADRPDFIRRFEFEARTVARIEHPNVVPLYDFWREPGAAYLVMRLLPGGSVEQALRSTGPYSREQTVRMLVDVGGALEAAHRAGVVHRDVRPANLLLDADGTTYLADFGIALPTAAIDDLPIRSPAYAAPEVLRGEPAGAAADIMSLAVTTFEVLTGRLPFADSVDRDELVRHQLADPLPPVRATRTDLPPVIDEILARATAKAPGDRYATVASFVDDVRSALAPPAPGARPAPIEWHGPATNPYVGLHAFDEEDADLYFGRERLVTELVDALEQRPMVTVVGPSGSGKSSVVRAGLLPAIRRGAIPGSDSWFVATMIPGPDPVDALETALLRVAVNPPATLREQLAEPGGLLRAIRRVLPDDRARLVLVVDQFEELFTQARDADAAERFLTELADAVTHNDSPVKVVGTLRADHYDAPLRHASVAELVTRGTVTVRPMTPEELGRAISLPATSVGVDVEPALVTELVAGVSARPAALPLLQFSLTELFDRRVANTMLLSTHHELGGLTGALAARADRIVAAGGPDDDAEVRRIFGRLVTFGEGAEDTRRRALRSEFGDGERTAWLLDAFVSARLLTTDRDPATREPTVEVAHEALLRDWPRLRTWLAEDRDLRRSVGAIGVAATVWDRGGRQASDLYRGGRLARATEIAETNPDWLRPLDHEFLDESRHQAEEDRSLEQRRVRRLRRLVGGTAAALVVALAAGGVAYTQQRRADRAAEAAELRELVARSAAAAVDRPEQALLIALEAYRRAPGPTTTRAVLDTVANGRFGGQVEAVERLADENCETAAAQRRRLSLDGRWEFGVVGAEAMRKDLETGEETRRAAAPSPCGGWWEDVETGRRWANSSSFSDHWIGTDSGEWSEVERRRGGGYLIPEALGDRLLMGQDGPIEEAGPSIEIVVVDAVSLEPVAPTIPELETDPRYDPLPSAAASRTAALFAIGTSTSDGGGLLVVLDASTGTEVFRVHRPSRVSALAFSEDGTTLLAGAADGTVATIDVASREVIDIVTMSQPLEVIALRVRSDGLLIAVSRRFIELFDESGEGRGSPVEIPLAWEAIIRPDGAVAVVPDADPDTLRIVEPNGGAFVERGVDVPADALVGFGAGRAVAATPSGSVEVIELGSADREEVELLNREGGRFEAVAVVPEADGYLAWDDGRTVARWRDGRLVEQLDLWSSQVPVSQTRSAGQVPGPLIDERGADPPAGGGYAGRGAVAVFEGQFAKALYAFDPTPGELAMHWANESPPFAVAVAPAPDAVHVLLENGVLRTYDLAGNRTQEFETGLGDAFVAAADTSTGAVALGGGSGAVLVDPSARSVQPVTDVGAVASLGFARDGTVLVAVELDGTVRLWDTVRGELIGALWNGNGTAPSSPPWYDESTDTVWVATSSKILQFSLEPSRWVERACALVRRELTADEWERLVPGRVPQRPACG
jgi:serine/threonine protein kinase/DNA-binding SARP family transcriptional activator/WD40 repeat protein